LARAVFNEFEGDPEKGVQGWAYWILSEFARRRGQDDVAWEAGDAARLIADALGMAPLAAQIAA
jgi:hypothetical protein